MATCDLAALTDQACENKFTCLDQRSRRFVRLQLLCNISSDEPPCINIITGDASYGIFDPHPYDVAFGAPLLPNTNYKLIAGVREASYQNEGGADTPLTNGQVVFFTSGPTPEFSLFGILGNTPVTAIICTV